MVSPLLLNIALHGMEEAAGVRRQLTGVHAGETRRDSPILIRYADDFLALCHSQEQAEQIKASLAGWLAPRGLVFNEDKTRIVNLDDGFDFLGFTVRRQSGKLLIKPSKAAIRRIRGRLRTEMRSLRGANVAMVLKRPTPIVRGWAAYYRAVVSSEVFSALDRYLWKLGRDHGLLPRLDHRKSPVLDRGGELDSSVGQYLATTSSTISALTFIS